MKAWSASDQIGTTKKRFKLRWPPRFAPGLLFLESVERERHEKEFWIQEPCP